NRHADETRARSGGYASHWPAHARDRGARLPHRRLTERVTPWSMESPFPCTDFAVRTGRLRQTYRHGETERVGSDTSPPQRAFVPAAILLHRARGPASS